MSRDRGSPAHSADEASFEERVGPAIEPVRRYLARRTDPDTAEDVLAETLLVCWRRRADLPGAPAEVLPWAYAVAARCLANAGRSARRRDRLSARLAAVDPPGAAAATPAAPDPRAELVAAALDALPATDAEVLRLWAWEGLEPRDLAPVLGTTAGAAASRLSRARAHLRAALTPAARQDRGGAGHEQGTEGDP